MKRECWTAVRCASWRDFSKISPKPAPLSVLSCGGGVARGVLTVECIVASLVDQCQLCPLDLKEGADNEA